MSKESLTPWDRQAVPEGTHGWIQWKGTEVCMDFYCNKCGQRSHIDDEFVYHIKCPTCSTVYMCNGHIQMIELSEEEAKEAHCIKTPHISGGI